MTERDPIKELADYYGRSAQLTLDMYDRSAAAFLRRKESDDKPKETPVDTLEERAAWIRESRRAAFWRGVVMGAAVMLLLTTCVGCATITPERAQKAAFIVIGGSIVATAIANGHGAKPAPALAVGPPPGLPCHPQPDGSCR